VAPSGLVEGAGRLAQKVRDTIMSIPTPGRKEQVDTSWDDSMVRKANESFRLAAERDRAAKSAKRSSAPKKKSRPIGR